NRTAVSVQAQTPESDGASASAAHETLQALKRALQSPQVRTTRGDSSAGPGAELRRFASEWRGTRGLISQAVDPFGVMRNRSRQVDRLFGELWRAAPVARLPELMPRLPDMVPRLTS